MSTQHILVIVIPTIIIMAIGFIVKYIIMPRKNKH
jgi:hypothetical protein